MNKVLSEELMKFINCMDGENSAIQFSIPGKRRFTLVLQEEDDQSIEGDVKNIRNLKLCLKKVQNYTGLDMEFFEVQGFHLKKPLILFLNLY